MIMSLDTLVEARGKDALSIRIDVNKSDTFPHVDFFHTRKVYGDNRESLTKNWRNPMSNIKNLVITRIN